MPCWHHPCGLGSTGPSRAGSTPWLVESPSTETELQAPRSHSKGALLLPGMEAKGKLTALACDQGPLPGSPPSREWGCGVPRGLPVPSQPGRHVLLPVETWLCSSPRLPGSCSQPPTIILAPWWGQIHSMPGLAQHQPQECAWPSGQANGVAELEGST